MTAIRCSLDACVSAALGEYEFQKLKLKTSSVQQGHFECHVFYRVAWHEDSWGTSLSNAYRTRQFYFPPRTEGR